jgi:hypothetical protein
MNEELFQFVFCCLYNSRMSSENVIAIREMLSLNWTSIGKKEKNTWKT